MTESTEAPRNAAGDLDAIVAALDAADGVLPEEAINAARLHKEAMIPRLIALVEDATRAVQAGEKLDKNGHFFALFLIAEFGAREALPAVLKAISIPGEGPFDLFGDAIHEVVPRALAVLAGGKDLDLVVALLHNKMLNEYVRWSAATALVAMVAAGIRSHDEIIELLRQSLRRAIDEQDSTIISGLICTLDELYPKAAFEEIKEAYAQHLVDEFLIDLASVQCTLAAERAEHLEKVTKRWGLIEDTVKELRGWASFREEKKNGSTWAPAPTVGRERPRSKLARVPSVKPKELVGRNDPCPCGSGKKFKKCCWLRQ